jgi:hypothetical protein
MDERLRFVARLLDGDKIVDVLCRLGIFPLMSRVYPSETDELPANRK